jgi:transposase
MAYSIDMRDRAVVAVKQGHSRQAVCDMLGIVCKTLYNWLRAEDLEPCYRKSRRHKLDKAALAAHVRDFPDSLLRERAAYFGVRYQSIWVALQKLGITKKNNMLSRSEVR